MVYGQIGRGTVYVPSIRTRTQVSRFIRTERDFTALPAAPEEIRLLLRPNTAESAM